MTQRYSTASYMTQGYNTAILGGSMVQYNLGLLCDVALQTWVTVLQHQSLGGSEIQHQSIWWLRDTASQSVWICEIKDLMAL